MSQVKLRNKSKLEDKKKNAEVQPEENKKAPKFGPLGIKNEDRIWSRGVMFASITIIIVVLKWRKMGQLTWASQKENISEARSHILPCSSKYLEEINKFEGIFCYSILTSSDYNKFHSGCKLKQCGRFVIDGLFQEEQIEMLVKIFTKGLENGRSSGGASILDLHSGALSFGSNFINVFETPGGQELWTEEEIAVYM